MQSINTRTFALTATTGAGFSTAYTQPRTRTTFWAEVPRWMEIATVPGVVAVVIEKGQVAEMRAFGVRRAGEAGAVDGDTIFEAASLSKPVFATVVHQLVEKKTLDLDQPLHEIIPLADDARAKLVTARHLLSHSSGMQNWRHSESDALQFPYAPGTQFSYSGEGYFYLQRVVEKLTGTPFSQLMRERLLAPLAMTRSSYYWREDANATVPHEFRGTVRREYQAVLGQKFTALATEWAKPLEQWRYEDVARAVPLTKMGMSVVPDSMQPNAASTLRTTANDYAKFLVHACSVERLREAQIKVNSGVAWGLGCGVDRTNNEERLFHWGDNPGYKCFFAMDAKARSGVLVFTNCDHGRSVYERIAHGVLGRDLSCFLWF